MLLKSLPYRLGLIKHPSIYHKQKIDAVRSLINFCHGKECPKWPLELFLEVSNICDLKCAMCPTFSALHPKRLHNISKVDRGLIDTDTATERLEEILKHVLVVHAFGYGEPTLHPDFKELIAYLDKFEVMVDFFTHGMHLTDDMCRFLVENSVSKITVSFSGATAEHYENVYIGGSFDRVTKGIKCLSRAKKEANSIYPKIEINSLAFKHHLQKFPEFVHLMGGLGADVIHLKPLQTYNIISELLPHASKMDPEIEGKIIQKAKNIARDYGMLISSRPYEDTASLRDKGENPTQRRHMGGQVLPREQIPIDQLKNIANSASKKKEMRSNTLLPQKEDSRKLPDINEVEYIQHDGIPCFEPFKSMYVSYDGKVYPCCFKHNIFPLGFLLDSYAQDVWNGELFNELRHHILRARKYPKNLCRYCLGASMYPKQLNVKAKIHLYSEWFSKKFDLPFNGMVCRQVDQLPDNSSIRSMWKTKLAEGEEEFSK